MSTVRSVISDRYRKKDIYANGEVLVLPYDENLQDVDAYNNYCQTPSVNTQFDQACTDLLRSAENSNDIVYANYSRRQIVEGNRIESGGYRIGESGLQSGLASNVRAGGPTMLTQALLTYELPLQTTMKYSTITDPVPKPFPKVMIDGVEVDVSENTRGFDVDDQGVIFLQYLTDTGSLDLYMFDPSQMAAPELVTQDMVPAFQVNNTFPMAVSANGQFVALVADNSATVDSVFVLVAVTSGNSLRVPFTNPRPGNRYTTEGVLVGDTGTIFYSPVADRRNDSPDGPGTEIFFLPVNSSVVAADSPQIVMGLSKRMSEDNKVYGYIFDPVTTNRFGVRFFLEDSTTVSINRMPLFRVGTELVTPCSMDLTSDGLNLIVFDQRQAQVTTIALPPTGALPENDDVPTGATSIISNWGRYQTRLFQDLALVADDDYIFYSTTLENLPLFRITERVKSDISDFPLMDLWSEVGYDIRLCNSGDILAIDSNESIVASSATVDDTVNSATNLRRGACDVRLAQSELLSSNGLYRATKNPTFLTQMVPHQNKLQQWIDLGIGQTQRGVDATAALREYCKDNFTDERCFCFENQENIVAQYYDIANLRLNSVLFNQLLLVAPCLDSTCRNLFREENMIGEYLRQFSCENDTIICNQTISVQDNAEIDVDGNFVRTADCGFGTQKACTGECPVGSVCEEGICRLVCSSENDAQCSGAFEECSSGLCVPKINAEKSKGINIGLVIALGVLTVSLVVWVAVVYTKRARARRVEKK